MPSKKHYRSSRPVDSPIHGGAVKRVKCDDFVDLEDSVQSVAGNVDDDIKYDSGAKQDDGQVAAANATQRNTLGQVKEIDDTQADVTNATQGNTLDEVKEADDAAASQFSEHAEIEDVHPVNSPFMQFVGRPLIDIDPRAVANHLIDEFEHRVMSDFHRDGFPISENRLLVHAQGRSDYSAFFLLEGNHVIPLLQWDGYHFAVCDRALEMAWIGDDELMSDFNQYCSDRVNVWYDGTVYDEDQDNIALFDDQENFDPYDDQENICSNENEENILPALENSHIDSGSLVAPLMPQQLNGHR
ncbi:hypothetical protein EJ06DRAFT_556886 [Trichodelitschia bisporula]|uniref:Uncharacterized protein n=1 Tax=Trichodelitschia bisporula TaxID=703511 RepID=A0A6G1HVA1_9PEZI|nr:hypothetical protein EJ06DRAFT_556886 [Trichodelitschia bisporula]